MTSLRQMLRLNALSCLIFGALFAILPGTVVAVLGNPPTGLVRAIGIGLLLNGLHLVLAAGRAQLRRGEVMWFSLGDLGWWTGSMALLASGVWVTTGLGIVLTAAVAAGVAGIGLAQLFQLGLTRPGARSGGVAVAHWRQIGASWMAMKLWVKIWLFVLNGVFLAAFAVMPSDLFRVTITAYVATGPLLLAFAFHDGGLTRAAGIGHLIPWTPLLIWLLAGLASGAFAGGEAGYAAALALAVAVCLSFDIYDVGRWMRGQRDPLGYPFADLKAGA